MSTPIAPTIPDSTNFNTNFTRLLKVTDSISASSYTTPNPTTSGFTVLSQGTLSGLNNPVLDSQAATYDYVLTQAGPGGVPGGVLKSVQFNNTGSFGGTSNFTSDKLTNTLTIPLLTNGPITIQNNTISGLIDPVLAQQAATKNYVDNLSAVFNVSTNSTVGPTVYTAASLNNGLINRDTQTSGTVTDTLPTAAQMVAETGASVGTAIYFSIRNANTDYDNILTFNVGAGMTLASGQNIFSGYQYNGLMVVTNNGLGTEAITIYTLSNAITDNSNWQMLLNGRVCSTNVVNITDFLMVFNEPILFNTNKVPAGVSIGEISNKVIYYTPTPGFTTVSIATPENILSAGGILPLFYTSGGSVDFYIINESTVDSMTVDGVGGSWTIDPNSNMTIPPGHTGQFMITIYFTDWRDSFTITSATIYCLGIFPTF